MLLDWVMKDNKTENVNLQLKRKLKTEQTDVIEQEPARVEHPERLRLR